MNRFYTSIKQSKHLLSLGMNPDTADMYWTALNWQETDYYVEVKQNGINMPKKYVPSWSLVALLEIMQKENHVPFLDSNAFIGFGDGLYRCVYLNGDWESSHQTIGETPIEAAFDMICWLLENDYIKKGE